MNAHGREARVRFIAGVGVPACAAMVLFGALLMPLVLVAPARAQVCTGNCNEDGEVTVDELLPMARIALGTDPTEVCSPGDANGDGSISLDELIRAINYALEVERPPVAFAGACRLPLVACADGTPVRAWRCDDPRHCLDDSPAMRVLIAEGAVQYGARSLGGVARALIAEGVVQKGAYTLAGVTNCRISPTYVVTAEVATETVYRTLRFDRPGAEGTSARVLSGAEAAADLNLSPTSEATVRLVQQNGLANFGGETFSELLMAVEQANPPESLVGRTPAEAAEAATQVAQEDAQVQGVIATVARHSLIGTWIVENSDSTIDPRFSIVFVDETHYLMTQQGDGGPGGYDGFEQGTYSWNATTGELQAHIQVDNNGEWGFSNPQGSLTIRVNGDQLTYVEAAGESGTFSRLKAQPANPLIGSWVAGPDDGSPGRVVLTFFDGSHFMFAQQGGGGPGGYDGIERGTSSWNRATGAFTVQSIEADTNGEWGFSDPTGPIRMVVTSNSTATTLSVIIEGADGTHTAVRVP